MNPTAVTVNFGWSYNNWESSYIHLLIKILSLCRTVKLDFSITFTHLIPCPGPVALFRLWQLHSIERTWRG